MARALASFSSTSSDPASGTCSSSLRLPDQLRSLLLAPGIASGRRRLHSAVVLAHASSSRDGSSDGQSCRIKSLLVLTALSMTPIAPPVLAVSAEDITVALLKVQDATGKAMNAVGSTYAAAKSLFEQFLSTVKPAVEVATPIASDVASQAVKVLKDAGVDTKPVLDTAKSAALVAGEAAEQTVKVIEDAKPVASSTLESIVTADPLFIADGAGALLLLYLLSPSLLSSIAYAARGYKGDLSAAHVLMFLRIKYV
ncbi:hypothetical protein KP509_15G011300 [Ceratopteris richardii]|uniref:Uncharacterized protein n=1 Tax=Ceratopteris richardii TaxID=49495 RepID=A0A8T2T589_CERRI|nr:hypothetical protein KP509_15G011300 [Ceratopteris richardii]